MSRAVMQQAQALTDVCAKLVQEALPHAEWQDKHIHPVGRETYQNWKVTVYLPVPLSEADKSPQAALTRAVEAEVVKASQPLTDADIDLLYMNCTYGAVAEFARAIEAEVLKRVGLK